jgi:Fibronectin type III domain/Abnormal spindle-like microcephaly-assoc'd, ASPM-SPD-2-Hydin
MRMRRNMSPIGARGARIQPLSALALSARLAGLTGLLLAGVVAVNATTAVAATTIGPVFPAPGSGTWTSTGTPTGGEIGKAGGITWTYTGVDPTQFDQMVWGLGYPNFPSTFSFGLDTATLAFDPTTSNLSGGVLNFTGSAEFPNLDGSTPSYPIQLTVTTATGPSAFEAPSSLTGLTVDPSAGGVLPVTEDFSVNLIIQVSTDGGTTWTPANDYFNNTPHTAGVSTSSSVQGDFWYTPVGAPAVSFGQSPLAFGAQPIGTTTPLTEVVTNTGTAPLDITEIDAGGDYSAPSDTCVGNSIAAGSSCSIDVDFTPSVTGTDNGSLVLTDNAPDSPQTLQLTGSGTEAEAVLSPNPVNFGTVVIGSSDQQVLTVSNPGTATLDLTNAQLTGADPGDFQVTGVGSGCVGQPPTVPAGSSCGVQITFTPGGTGTRSATLTVTDNASPSTQSVTLTGIGAPLTTVPGAPTGVSALPGNGQISVSWTAPTSDGGLPIAGYIVSAATAGGGTTFTETLNSPATSAIMGGLSNGTAYDVTVEAVNSDGAGPAGVSSDNPVTPTSAAPLITSANSLAVAVGHTLTFKVTAVGKPKPTMGASGLPSWLTFTPAAAGGSGTLTGPAPVGSGGVYPLTFTASNGVGFPVTQNATLSVLEFTSATSATFTLNQSDSFTVTTSLSPAPVTLSLTGTLPPDVSFIVGTNGTATLSGVPTGKAKNYQITFKATFGTATLTQKFTLTTTG